ncbi:UNVERIFIED_CONTAM: hypothetical protein K2H54_022157 [Gekko kuhli]
MPKGWGKSWMRAYVFDLLAFWGDQKIQAALSEGPRNIEIFGKVAAGMAAQGHKKTAFECCAKALQLKYKKTVALNEKSSHNTVTCAYYKELDRILRKNKDIHPEGGILQTHQRWPGQRATQIPTPSLEDASQELFMDGSQDTLEPQPSTSSHAGTPETPVDDDQEAEEPMEDGNPDQEHLPPDINMADLTAGERAALTKARKKRVLALQSISECLAAQAQEDHREAQRKDQRDIQEFLVELRAAQQEDQEARAMMLAVLERSIHLTDELTRVVNLLVQTHCGRPTPAHPCHQDLGAVVADGVPADGSVPGNSSAVQWPMPPQPPQTAPPSTSTGAPPVHPMQPSCSVTATQPPDTIDRAQLHKPLGPTSPSAKAGSQCCSHPDPSNPGTTDGAHHHRPLDPSSPSVTGGPQ